MEGKRMEGTFMSRMRRKKATEKKEREWMKMPPFDSMSLAMFERYAQDSLDAIQSGPDRIEMRRGHRGQTEEELGTFVTVTRLEVRHFAGGQGFCSLVENRMENAVRALKQRLQEDREARGEVNVTRIGLGTVQNSVNQDALVVQIVLAYTVAPED